MVWIPVGYPSLLTIDMNIRPLSVRLTVASLALAAFAALGTIGAQASGYTKALDSVQEFLGLSAPARMAHTARSVV